MDWRPDKVKEASNQGFLTQNRRFLDIKRGFGTRKRDFWSSQPKERDKKAI